MLRFASFRDEVPIPLVEMLMTSVLLVAKVGAVVVVVVVESSTNSSEKSRPRLEMTEVQTKEKEETRTRQQENGKWKRAQLYQDNLSCTTCTDGHVGGDTEFLIQTRLAALTGRRHAQKKQPPKNHPSPPEGEEVLLYHGAHLAAGPTSENRASRLGKKVGSAWSEKGANRHGQRRPLSG